MIAFKMFVVVFSWAAKLMILIAGRGQGDSYLVKS